jgi:hypothetical protein
MYARLNSFRFEESHLSLFNYAFAAPSGTLEECSGILTYESTFLMATIDNLKERIVSYTPMTDITSAKYNLLVLSSESYFIQKLD